MQILPLALWSLKKSSGRKLHRRRGLANQLGKEVWRWRLRTRLWCAENAERSLYSPPGSKSSTNRVAWRMSLVAAQIVGRLEGKAAMALIEDHVRKRA